METRTHFRAVSVNIVLLFALLAVSPSARAWAPIETRAAKRNATIRNGDNSPLDRSIALSTISDTTETRRELLQKAVRAGASAPVALASLLAALSHRSDPALAAEEKCDPSDVRCRQGGKLGDAPSGKPIPKVTNRITYVVQMIVDVGERGEEAGYIRFGLYGDDCPGSAKQMLLFLTRGITSTDKETLEGSIGLERAPVSLQSAGSVPNIYPGKGVDFGVPSQSKAYSRSRGLRAAGPNFVPQGKPTPTLEGEAFPRPHSVAGLISVPAKGIGYGGGGIVAEPPDDEIYSSAFFVTAGEAPALDVDGNRRQRVIGQIIDDESMEFLDRLANLPVQKKGRKDGSGPPLLKVRVRDVDVQKVKTDDEKNKKNKRKK